MQIIFLLTAILSVSIMGNVKTPRTGNTDKPSCANVVVGDDNKCITNAGPLLGLSKKGEAAFYDLRGADTFEAGHVGYAGTLSKHVISLYVLLEEKEAASALRVLLDEGTTAGKLYALNGLYHVDHETFLAEANEMKQSQDIVKMMDGCMISEESVAKIIDADVKNVAIIEPGTTSKEFWDANTGKSFVFDIIHGGYPANFRELGKRYMQDSKDR